MKKHILHHVEEEHRGWFVVSSILIGALYYFYLTQAVDMRQAFIPLLEGTKYSIDGELITLQNGTAITSGSPTKEYSTVTVVGVPLLTDLNGDGLKDIVFLLEQKTARGEYLSYVGYAIRMPDSYVGSNTIYLGRNVDAQILPYADREISINFVGKTSNIGVAKYYIVRDNVLTEVARSR